MVATSQAQLERLRGWVAKRRHWGPGRTTWSSSRPARSRRGARRRGARRRVVAALRRDRPGAPGARVRRGGGAARRHDLRALAGHGAPAGSVLTPRGRLRRATWCARRRRSPSSSPASGAATCRCTADDRDGAVAGGGLGRARLVARRVRRRPAPSLFYAQRTPDDRLALGGRGAPYRLGSPIDEANERNDAVRTRLVETVRRHFAAAAAARITYHWGGALAVPRDWSSGCAVDPETGLGGAAATRPRRAGGHMTGRTLADLVRGADTELTRLPWVGHAARAGSREPLRFVASRAIVAVMGSADRAEERLGRRRAACGSSRCSSAAAIRLRDGRSRSIGSKAPDRGTGAGGGGGLR